MQLRWLQQILQVADLAARCKVLSVHTAATLEFTFPITLDHNKDVLLTRHLYAGVTVKLIARERFSAST